jgi:hypothetical protein
MQFTSQMECAIEAILSVPATPQSTYPLRLTLAASQAAPDFPEQFLWKAAAQQTDRELLHRVNTIHHAMCADIRLGALTEVVKQALAAQEKGLGK